MTDPRRPGPASPGETENVLLARLGLPPTASPDEIDGAHERIVGFLSSAPGELGAWARAQASIADEAYALLGDPSALARSRAIAGPVAPTAPGRPGTDAGRQAPAGYGSAEAGPPAAPAEPAELSADELAELVATVTPSAHRDTLGRHRPSPETASEAPASAAGRTTIARRVGLVAVATVTIVAVAIGGYGLGGGGAPARTAAPDAAAATDALDRDVVVALMERIQADPDDTEALKELGYAFFVAGDYEASAGWFEKLVAANPEDVAAHLDLGVARRNSGDTEGARAAWEQALSLDPDNVDAHYYLGFLYLNARPPDTAGVEREWGEVLRLAPDSDQARVVQAQLEGLASARPAASPAGGGTLPGPSPAAGTTPTQATPLPGATP